MTNTKQALNAFVLVKISGEDAETFLQGQLTNDITATQNCWQYSGYCSPKGRLIALFRIWQYQGEFWALLDVETAQAAIKRLRMYVMRSKVTIDLLSGVEICAIYSGKPQENFQRLPESALNMNAMSASAESFALGFANRALVINNINSGFAEGTLNKNHSETNNTKTSNTANDQRWLSYDINSGLPSLRLKTAESFIPQMLNLDFLRGISFKKGCYTGQEIVARLHYLGKLKQRMLVCELTDPSHSINAGDKLVNSAGKVVGDAVSNSEFYLADRTPIFLAVLRLDTLADSITTAEGGHSVLIKQKQPYELSDS